MPNENVPTAGGEGKAVVHDGSGKEVATIKLTPAGDNIFKGKGDYKLDQDSTVVVFVKMPDQEAWAAEFMPLKPKASAAMHDMTTSTRPRRGPRSRPRPPRLISHGPLTNWRNT